MQFTTFQITKKLNINRNTLQQWLDRGLIHPSIQKASGQGTKNIFSLNDVYQIGLFQKLYQVGFTQKIASELSQNIDFANVGEGDKSVEWVMISRHTISENTTTTLHYWCGRPSRQESKFIDHGYIFESKAIGHSVVPGDIDFSINLLQIKNYIDYKISG